MRDYQAKKKNPYWLEPSLHYRVIGVVRDYPRMLAKRRDILHGSPTRSDVSGAPKGVPSDPTAQRALRLARVDADLRIVDAALRRLPREYRGPVYKNVLYEKSGYNRGVAAADVPCTISTFSRYRAWFLWLVAENMGLVSEGEKDG